MTRCSWSTKPLAAISLRNGLQNAYHCGAAAVGAGAAYLSVQLLFVWGYEALTGRRGMGEGDSKLLMMIGAFLGWKGALFALVGGAMQGLVFAIVAGLALIATAFATTIPMVIGTTGLDGHARAALERAAEIVPIVYAPNYSQGVNALYFLAARAAELLGPLHDREQRVLEPDDRGARALDVHQIGFGDSEACLLQRSHDVAAHGHTGVERLARQVTVQ